MAWVQMKCRAYKYSLTSLGSQVVSVGLELNHHLL